MINEKARYNTKDKSIYLYDAATRNKTRAV